jgi:hypothetical protein
LYFEAYPVDGYLCYKQNDKTYIKILQYQSLFYHGHKVSCPIVNDENQLHLAEQTLTVKHTITDLYEHFIAHFCLDNVHFEYVEIYDCDFPSHKIPNTNKYVFPFKNAYTYTSFLTNIYNKDLTGFLVVKDLEIKKNSQNPLFGFLLQKVQYELKHLSQYTQQLVKRFHSSQRVISIHKAKNFMVISTHYFLWLHTVFGFENMPDIYHAMLFQMDTYLTKTIESKLKLRKELKALIKTENDINTKQVYEIKAELIKLMLNSCYGFTLCNVTSSKFKMFKNLTSVPTSKKR